VPQIVERQILNPEYFARSRESPDQAGTMLRVIVLLAQSTDFSFTPGRVNGEPHDIGHRNLR
jgi:hypothetical protein